MSNYISSPNYRAKQNLKDLAGLTLVQGDILYESASGLVNLGAGTAGTFLKTQGSGANPVWDTPAGSGDVVGPASATGDNVVFFDGTTGKLIKDSGLTLSGSNTGDQDLSSYVTLIGTQTLTNKTLTDATTYLQDETDNTKKLQFQLSGITTATTRTLTIPDKSFTIADNADIPISTTDLTEGTNLYYTEARVSVNSDVAANTDRKSVV